MRDLADVVKSDDFVLDSEYLTTLLVVVPKALVQVQFRLEINDLLFSFFY